MRVGVRVRVSVRVRVRVRVITEGFLLLQHLIEDGVHPILKDAVVGIRHL